MVEEGHNKINKYIRQWQVFWRKNKIKLPRESEVLKTRIEMYRLTTKGLHGKRRLF